MVHVSRNPTDLKKIPSSTFFFKKENKNEQTLAEILGKSSPEVKISSFGLYFQEKKFGI